MMVLPWLKFSHKKKKKKGVSHMVAEHTHRGEECISPMYEIVFGSFLEGGSLEGDFTRYMRHPFMCIFSGELLLIFKLTECLALFEYLIIL